MPPVAAMSEDFDELEERIEESECHFESREDTNLWRSLSKSQNIGLGPLAFWHSPWGMPNIAREDLPSTVILLHQTHVTGQQCK